MSSTAAPQSEENQHSLQPPLEAFFPEFSSDFFSDPQPPGTDPLSTDTDLLLQTLLSELSTDIISLPTSSLSPTLDQIPSPSPASTPSPSLSSSTHASSPRSSVPEGPAQDTDTHDPLLVGFADLEGLLNDSCLLESPTSVSPHPEVCPFPQQDAVRESSWLLDLSDCLSLCSASVTPHSESLHSPLSVPQPTISPHPNTPPPPTSPTAVIHDHTYTSLSSHTTNDSPSSQRKRKSSAVSDSLLSPDSSDTDSLSPKKMKTLSKGEKYHVRRQKNNVASQISRSKRRARHKDLFSRVEELERANIELRQRAREMEQEAEKLRKCLVQKLAT